MHTTTNVFMHKTYICSSVLSLHKYLLRHASIKEPTLRVKALVTIRIATNLNANIIARHKLVTICIINN